MPASLTVDTAETAADITPEVPTSVIYADHSRPVRSGNVDQVHDITQADALLALVEPEALLADKGYDADHFVETLTARAIKVVIPPKSNRKVKRDCDFALYCERNIVERFFNIIKHFRAIATRYEKTAQNFLAGLHLVCALSWLK